jgi:hypothetical protein
MAIGMADLLILMTTVIVVDRVAYIIELAVFGAMTRELLYTAVGSDNSSIGGAAHLLMALE